MMQLRINTFSSAVRRLENGSQVDDLARFFAPTLLRIRRFGFPHCPRDRERYIAAASNPDDRILKWGREDSNPGKRTKMGRKMSVQRAQQELFALQVYRQLKAEYRSDHRDFRRCALAEMALGAAGLDVEEERLKKWERKWRS